MSKKVAPYLRHRPTGDIYPYNEHLAKRDDVEPVNSLPKTRGGKGSKQGGVNDLERAEGASAGDSA